MIKENIINRIEKIIDCYNNYIDISEENIFKTILDLVKNEEVCYHYDRRCSYLSDSEKETIESKKYTECKYSILKFQKKKYLVRVLIKNIW